MPITDFPEKQQCLLAKHAYGDCHYGQEAIKKTAAKTVCQRIIDQKHNAVQQPQCQLKHNKAATLASKTDRPTYRRD